MTDVKTAENVAFDGVTDGGGTHLARRDYPAAPPPRRRVSRISRSDILNVAGAFLGALCLTALLFGRLAPFSGFIGFIVVTYLAFLGIYTALVMVAENGPAVKDAVMTVLLYSVMLLVLTILVGVAVYIFWNGRTALDHLNFYTQDLSSTGPNTALTQGGIKHAEVGTLWTIAIALAIVIPLGIPCALYLNISRSRFSRFVRTLVEAMTALPSVLAGLFIFATWILILHKGKTGFAAALALSVEMLPILIRASDVVLRLVPGNLREASEALGSTAWRSARYVILPTARSGLVTAVILATARGIGETAPVLLTAGYTTYLNNNPLKGPMVTLPLVAFELIRSGTPDYTARGFGAASVLLIVVLILFVLARVVGGRGPGNLSAGQLRRVMRASSRDRDRFIEQIKAREAAQHVLEVTPS